MPISRKIIFAVLFPVYDSAVKDFRKLRTGLHFAVLQSVMLAMQCADAQPERILRLVMENVDPNDYIKVLCTYQDTHKAQY